MTDFSSIDDLTTDKKDDHHEQMEQSDQIKVASDETKQEFESKMEEIESKQKEREAKVLAKKLGFSHIDLVDFSVTQDALKLMDKEEVKEKEVVPFFYNVEELRLGAVDPRSQEVQQLKKRLAEEKDANVEIYVISNRSFEHALKLYDRLPTVKEVRKEIDIDADKLQRVQSDISDFSSLAEKIDDADSTTDIVTFILGAGLKLGASDVHIEAEEDNVQVRLRIDGILHDVASLPREEYENVVSRIKLVASLKLNITDEPQDGRFTINMGESEVDVRVSTVPTVYGESIVMRLLRQDRGNLSLEDLGLHEKYLKMLKEQINRPNGMIITTGPTGSGKTTTLYSVMNVLNEPEVKIITLENPVEYKMQGVNQSEVGEDYSFAKGLESMLRQDPDIAMVGEIRNLETAETAIQSSLTGHLILSTLHTNDASGAIPRFLSMGAKPFLLAPALNCIIGQRLVRKLCDNCKQEVKLDEQQQKRVNKQIENMPDDIKQEAEDKSDKFYTADGCDECNEIGYEGRVGIFEIFVIDDQFEDMILSGDVAAHEIEDKAIEQGMMTMVQDGILKALDGVTSVSEVFRVIE
jgi:type II secretory ATPase GspE/PulE/Tfp pilus assembly ATPase PilB-like protein